MSKKGSIRARAAARLRRAIAYRFSTAQAVVGGLVVLIIGVGIGANTGAWDRSLTVLGLRKDVSALDLSTVQKTYETLAANYDGKLDTAKLIDGANHGLVAAVGDPYTVYFSKSEASDFASGLDGSFEGIGAELSLQDGVITVASTLDGSPAKKAGLQAGDKIIRVGDTSTEGWSVDRAVSSIRGKAGTDVTLTYVRDDTSSDVTITRQALTDPSVTSDVTDNVGVLRISRFGDTDTVRLAREAAASFKARNVKGVILDLRGNGGGYVDAAQGIASLWLDGKTVVSEKTNGVTTDTIRSDRDPLLAGVPTIVLIDGGSASASEIVAGALRDNGAATLYGQKSFGKGVVQNIFDLDAGTQLKVTVARWYTPKGDNIDKTGITPGVVITPTDAQISAGEDVVKAAALAKLNG